VTQELRIQSPKELGAMKWLAGLYYSNEDEDYNDYSNTYDTKSSYGYNVKYNWPGDRGEKTMAVFGQLTIPLFSRLNLTTGLRYETIHKDINYKSQVTRTDTGEKLTSDVEWSRDEDWEALLPKGVFSWDINKDVMVYFSIAQGYLAGGFNGWGDDPDTATFDEQTSWNYEIGAKTAWFNNRLFFNSTLFYIDIDDMHVWSNPSTGIWIASNAAKAHSQGVEIEIKAKPLQGLDITAALGWTDVEFDDYKISDTSDYTGNTPIQTPEYTFNLSAQYRFNTGFFVRMEMEGYGKTYYNEENTLERSPFQLYHAKIGYETSNWEVYLYGNNLSDKKYFSTINNERHTVGSPRTLGVVASVRF
jgi:iron complex outermembrane receptor protein